MSAYNGFNHLCHALFVTGNDFMAMLSIYCDDSGTDPKNRVAVVAGYLGQVKQWKAFDKEWRATLKEFGVKRMRMADLENYQGEFRDGWNEARRIKILKRLHTIIRNHTKMAIGCAVIKTDFEAIIPQEIKEKLGGVFGWCVHDCLVGLAEQCRHHRYNKPIRWVFEAGTIGHGQVDSMFRELLKNKRWDDMLIKGLAFENKDTTPLQAADILAYEGFKQVKNQIVDKGRKRTVRLSLKNLVHASDERYFKYWDKKRLRQWLDEYNYSTTS